MKLTAQLFLVSFLISCSDSLPEPSTQELLADFDYEILGDCTSSFLEVVINNKSTPQAAYAWNFGDGTTANEVNPKKVFAKSGVYEVTLTVSLGNQSKTISKEVSVAINSDGTGPTGTLTLTENSPLSFNFNFTSNADSAVLYFGDGIMQKPKITSGQLIYTYAAPGSYSVVFFMQNAEGCTCISKLIQIP